MIDLGKPGAAPHRACRRPKSQRLHKVVNVRAGKLGGEPEEAGWQPPFIDRSPAIKRNSRRIQAHLQKYLGRGRALPQSEMDRKVTWAEKCLPELPAESKPFSLQTRIRRWREGAQERRWKKYQESLESVATPAQIGD